MLINIQNIFISQLNKIPFLKKKMLQIYDFYCKYTPLFVGHLTRNPAYIKNLWNSKVIAKPGTLGFKGGTFNPGVLALDEYNILLLAKAQIVPWFKARGKNKKFFMVGNPVAFILDNKSLKTKQSVVTTNIVGFPKKEEYAIEDFRLFKWKGKTMVNHSLITKGTITGFVNQTLVRSAISIFNEKEKTLQFCALPKVDYPLQDSEKNWVYKENGNQLLLFYSLNPYKVLVLKNEENFSFKTIINKMVSSKFTDPGGFGTLVSLSTNPIDYDDKYWLIVIHQIEHKFTGRCYFHWAVLIDKLTLLPVKITSKPIFSGMGARGRTPGIRYISSVIKIENEILFFAGEGDVYLTVTKKSIVEINDLFVGI